MLFFSFPAWTDHLTFPVLPLTPFFFLMTPIFSTSCSTLLTRRVVPLLGKHRFFFKRRRAWFGTGVHWLMLVLPFPSPPELPISVFVSPPFSILSSRAQSCLKAYKIEISVLLTFLNLPLHHLPSWVLSLPRCRSLCIFLFAFPACYFFRDSLGFQISTFLTCEDRTTFSHADPQNSQKPFRGVIAQYFRVFRSFPELFFFFPPFPFPCFPSFSMLIPHTFSP